MASPRPLWQPLRRALLAQAPQPSSAAATRARFLSSTTPNPNANLNTNTNTDTSPSHHANPQPQSQQQQPPKPLKPLTPAQQSFLSSALRVNQAGELAATLIYTAQTPPILAREPHLRPLMQHMYEQEASHLRTFNALIAKHRVRPTALYPLWSAMATGLGWTTAVMGREAAMACTEAVETEIGGHYNSQIRTLLEMVSGWEAEGYDVGDEFRELISTLRRIRDEELEHLDHAVEHDAQKAQPHWLLTGVIRAGCRGAIWVSERV